MGWLSDEPGHEGYPASILQGGTSTGTSTTLRHWSLVGARLANADGLAKTFYPAIPSDDGFYPNDIDDAANAEWRDHMAPLGGHRLRHSPMGRN